MSKIKLSLPSGSEVEKTVLSYFNNGGNYLVLDAESVGSMGLPIILVSKVTDKAEKIIDQNEWQQVKGYLKNIISGGQTTYLAAPESIQADETYYTQLTLPVASFDSLKNYYVAPATPAVTNETVAETAPAEVTPTEPLPDVAPSEASVNPITDIPAVDQNPVAEEVTPIAPVTDVAPSVPTENVAEVSDIPTENVEQAPVVPTEPLPGVGEMSPVNMSTEEIPETPIVEEVAPIVDQVDTTQGTTEPVPSVPVVEEPIVNEGLNASEEAAVIQEAAPVVEESPVPQVEEAVPTVEPVAETPAIPETPEVPSMVEEPVIENTPAEEVAPMVADAPAVDPAPIVEEEAPVADIPMVEPVIDAGSPETSVQTPVVETEPTIGNASIEEIKNKFIKACEEMFDSLAALK